MRLSSGAYQNLLGKRPSKYHNDKVNFRGLTFDSKKEFEFYLILKDREKRGEISDLQRQVVYEIQPAFTDRLGNKHRAITYKADFVYKCGDMVHVVDVKGMKTEVYKIKKKLLAYKGVIIEEV